MCLAVVESINHFLLTASAWENNFGMFFFLLTEATQPYGPDWLGVGAVGCGLFRTLNLREQAVVLG